MNLLKSLLFLVVAPGTILVFIPWRILGNRVDLGVWNALGVPLVALGVAGLLRCFWVFATVGHGTPAPIDPPRLLVQDRLYRVSRNPMYLTVLTALGGEVLIFGSATLLAEWFLCAAAFHLFVVFYEEPHLLKRFGESYAAYRRDTPRWMGVGRTKAFWRDSHWRTAALLYTGGAAAHLARVAFGFPIEAMPYERRSLAIG